MKFLDPNLSARHFTDEAQLTVCHIRLRAANRGMFAGELNADTAEMLAVLSMLRWEQKVGRAALERIVANCDALARELDEAIKQESEKLRRPTGTEFMLLPSGQKAIVWDTQSSLKRLLDQAEHEAMELGHNWVGTEHLLLVAVRSNCPRFQELFQKHGVNHAAVKQAILELLRC